MNYLELVEKLQKSAQNKGDIVIIRSGIFFIGIDRAMYIALSLKYSYEI